MQALESEALLANNLQSHSSAGFRSSPARKKKPLSLILACFEDQWWIEILSLGGSVASFVGLVALLAHYDPRPQPNWSRLSLNTVISFLSVISKGLLLIPVNRALGQLKWSWFKTASRPLDNLRSFDKASRGVLGCFDLLWLTKGM